MQIEHLHGNNGQDEDSCPACTGLYELPELKPIDTHLLTASLNSLELLRQELVKEHAETCDGFVELDPQYDGDPNEGKKVICKICWPDEYIHLEQDRDGEDR